MKRLIQWLFPPQHDAHIAEEVKRANIALEQSRRANEEEVKRATADHKAATDRLTKAMVDSVEITKEALRKDD